MSMLNTKIQVVFLDTQRHPQRQVHRVVKGTIISSGPTEVNWATTENHVCTS